MNKDRGMLKWQPALMLPELKKLHEQVTQDYFRVSKPILDEYLIQEIEEQITYSMEYILPVTITLYNDGFPKDIKGFFVYLDPINKKIKFELEDQTFLNIKFSDILDIMVHE
ncbi:YolD-like family protein [Peribacillus sp. R9-11]|uniref:YolD-like family protein n=1 Tax=Peribacillus sp. R9-11 TaxID=3073271 RepID=UPI0028694867|nr:YolD-like family protein [Peribacillus sp. R9-11]WMX58506.1 YolD-like family protein [Peribacillus sp. R9-11]